MTSRRFPTHLTAAVAVTALLVASCGDDDDAADDAAVTDPAASDPAASAAPADTAAAEPAPTTAPAATTLAPDLSDLYGESDSADTTVASGDGDDTGVVAMAETALGEVLVDSDGFTLYGFTPDAGGTPTCVEECAAAWPPLYVDEGELPAGLDAAVFSVVEHPEGGSMLRAGEWPLYTFAGDVAPGDTNGQGLNGVWFAVDPTGQLVET